ncbi:MAG: hypothetical protein J5J00_17555 [Deltaproteobacteria bacterium]|nr:hypothetical protein [Deltaproteobacteria bacterium]
MGHHQRGFNGIGVNRIEKFTHPGQRSTVELLGEKADEAAPSTEPESQVGPANFDHEGLHDGPVPEK